MATDRYRILIIEGNVLTLYVLAQTFQRGGWEVCTAKSVAEALTCLDPTPDCVVVNLNLPDGAGEPLLDSIRERDLLVKVVVVVASHAHIDRLGRIAEYKPNLVILKPFDCDILLRYCESEVGRPTP